MNPCIRSCCPRHHVVPDGPCGPLAPELIVLLQAVAYEAVDHGADGSARRLGAGVLALASDLVAAHGSLGRMTAHRDALLRARERDQDELRTLRSPA